MTNNMNSGDIVRCTRAIHLMVADINVGEVGIVHDCDEWRGYANVQFVRRLLFHMLPITHLEVVDPMDYSDVMQYYSKGD